jgi:hypothetical protein
MGVSGSPDPGDASLAPGSSDVAGPCVSGQLLPGFPCLPPLPIDWRQAEGDVEVTCS